MQAERIPVPALGRKDFHAVSLTRPRSPAGPGHGDRVGVGRGDADDTGLSGDGVARGRVDAGTGLDTVTVTAPLALPAGPAAVTVNV